MGGRRTRARSLWAGALLLGVAAGCGGDKPWSVPAADPATHRATIAGEVVGGEGRYGSHAWLGIPFAAPPVGDLRWRAPRPPAPWTGVRPALEFASACPQYASPIGGPGGRPGDVIGSEDCLYLNVWTPRFPSVPAGAERRPVMVWIHGGGNSIGTASFYDGGHLAAARDVVVVSVQYRLGPFGWLAHRALRADAPGDDERSGNFGTLDHVRALEWVRDNISAFGGDPGNVTIFGESAGGFDVYALLRSPRAKGLFHRAIAQSGGLYRTTPADAERWADDAPPGHRNSSSEVIARMLQQAGLAKDRAEARARLSSMPEAELAAWLRARTPEQVLRGAGPASRLGMLDLPLVFADGAVVAAGEPLELFSRPDGWNRVPVLVGTNRDEYKLFLFWDPTLLRRRFGLVPRYVDENAYETAAEYLSRTWKATGADEPAAAMRRSGAADVYVYRFDWADEPVRLGADMGRMLGAAHALEIPFVFGHFDLGREGRMLFPESTVESRRQLSEWMMSYWTEFARTGRPGRGRAGDQPEWLAWDDSAPERPKFLVLDTAAKGGPRMSAQTESRAALVAGVDRDSRLKTRRERCSVYRHLAGILRGIERADYPTAGREGCADYPIDEYPWQGR